MVYFELIVCIWNFNNNLKELNHWPDLFIEYFKYFMQYCLSYLHDLNLLMEEIFGPDFNYFAEGL
jgi:hypothetical protein